MVGTNGLINHDINTPALRGVFIPVTIHKQAGRYAHFLQALFRQVEAGATSTKHNCFPTFPNPYYYCDELNKQKLDNTGR